MKINHLDEVFSCVNLQEAYEGLFGVLTTHSVDYNFGSRTDLPGFKLPATAAEASKARFMLGHAVTNVEPPIYEPAPYATYQLRQGFGGADTAPFNATVHVTPPSLTEGVPVASGAVALAFGAGVYTIPSGLYIDNASLVAGAPVVVANTAEDGASNAGKLKYQATVDSRVIGFVVRKESDGSLVVKVGM